ncbi:DUF1311 domain-containing protein [bacterium]|nr:DUF1311 domain-containing protein [bacterium]
MKKFILIFIIIFLSFCSIVSLVYAIKCNTQVKELNAKISKLNNTISEISSENDILSEDKDFAQKQYQDLKLTKKKAELIDIEIQECMKSCNYTTVCMNDCVYEAIPKWEKEIDKNIKLLEKIMDKEQSALLFNSQKQWLLYKNAQQKLNSETIGTMMGTMYTNILAADQINLIKLRAKELDELYYIYSKK